jgi:hypothetical protein
MTRVMLDHIVMKRESKSFTDSLYAVLTGARLFNGPKYMLSGLSGMAYKFTVHKRLLPLSVTAYGQWGTEHKPAVDNLGVYTEMDGGRTRHPTFPYYQQDAVKWIKQSLDRGLGVIYWIPEFGVIHGYDDEDNVFYVLDGRSAESVIVLYDNLGLNFTGFWYGRIVGGKVEVDLKEQVLESMRLALHDWATPHKTLPDNDIGSGRLAYSFLINGLQQGDYDERGAVYIINTYLYSRREIIQYLHDVQGELAGLYEAYHMYAQMEALLANMAACMYERDGSRLLNKQHLVALCDLLLSAQKLEEQAMVQFRIISEQYPDRKRSTVPRWGSHIPR